MDDKRLAFLKEVYNDCRKEIEMRITQRDNFSIQFVTSVGVVCALALMEFKLSPFLFFLLPFISLFYTVQIMYSYSIHDRLHSYLINELEPEIAFLLKYNDVKIDKLFWETYCEVDSVSNKVKFPGIRKNFFRNASIIMPSIASIMFWLVGAEKQILDETCIENIAIIFFVGCTSFIIYILNKFNKRASHYDYTKYSEADCVLNRSKRKKKILFIDRDGTLHVDKVMTHKIDDLEYFPDTIPSLQKLQEMGYSIVIVTNQNGIRDKVYDVETMKKFHNKIIKDLEVKGIQITAIYYSPYKREDNHISYKPNHGMLLRGIYELNGDINKSYMIGDQITDIMAAEKIGIKSIMVTTGIYANKNYQTPEYLRFMPRTVSCLQDAVNMIESDEIKQNKD